MISCSSVNCGEKLMHSGWRRELRACLLLRGMVLDRERQEIERAAQADRKAKR